MGGLFEVEEWPAVAVKGIPGPVSAYRVLGEGRAEGRFEALRGTNPAPLVGRTHELALLLDRWERAKDGEGQVVLLAGEPGIGKSRLVSALRERLAHEPHTPLSQFCSPFHQTSALHPVIALLERAAGFARDDDPAQKLAKLEALLAQAAEGMAEAAPLLAGLLSIPTGTRYLPLSLSPPMRKERTPEALLGQLEGLARQRPVLAIYEDVHWADPTTLELLDRVVDRAQAVPALVVVTFRPEFVPPWLGRSHVTLLPLARLGRREGVALVGQVTGGKALPEAVLGEIVAKTDGVPLFVEELTKAVLESGLLRDDGSAYVLSGPLPPLAIPSTLHDSLLTRLDRLAPVREVAQIGACIGRVFGYELLAAVAPLGDSALREALAQLCEAELIFRRGTPPEATYTFKHALVQDAAYRSLLRGWRQQLHARIVEALEQHFPDRCEAEPEVLAQHCARARLVGKAVRYWLRAGELAIRRSAMAEAIAQLRTGLGLLEDLPDDRERASLELDLQIALGVASMGAQGWAAPEAGRANARALELCDRIGATAQLWPVLYGQWVFHAVRAEHAAARALGEELLRRAREHRDVPATVVAHRILGSGAFWRGEPVTAHEHLERALALYDPSQHRSLAFLYVQDPRVAALSGLAWALFVLGYPGQAWSHSGEALGAARAFGHYHTLAYALLFRCLFAQCCRVRRDVQDHAGALAALATEQNLPHFLGAATALRGWALSEAGQVDAGLAQLRQGLAAWSASGARLYEPHFLALQAEAHGRAGRAQEGVALMADAVDRARCTGERYFEAELLRLRGELLLSGDTPDPTSAEQCLVEALETARGQRARMWELRAATSLARLWRDRGRRQEARDLLAPAYGWFTEGAGTPDLKKAKALVDELG
ncbi:AAA family ATPase [Benzoatithermus flavus]|uniref:AAA family ATPase n=1 Tax=Benzoatithermus flavus TaxID=3108223 RepID=UPI003AACD76E